MPDRNRLIDLTIPEERAFLIGLDGRDHRWPVARSLAELAALTETAGASVVGTAFQRRSEPDPLWYFGKGRAAELLDEKNASQFNVLIVDDEISPTQQRSLERLLGPAAGEKLSALAWNRDPRQIRTHRRARSAGGPR